MRYKQNVESRSNAANKKYLREHLFALRGAQCERCGFDRNIRILVIHHIKSRAEGGGGEDSNLEILCPNCHAEHHLGRAPIGVGNSFEAS